MSTTRNKSTLIETSDDRTITGFDNSEYISMEQGDDIINIRCDRIDFLISSLERFNKNTKRTEV